jgi:hypothetical protein
LGHAFLLCEKGKTKRWLPGKSSLGDKTDALHQATHRTSKVMVLRVRNGQIRRSAVEKQGEKTPLLLGSTSGGGIVTHLA